MVSRQNKEGKEIQRNLHQITEKRQLHGQTQYPGVQIQCVHLKVILPLQSAMTLGEETSPNSCVSNV